jgi:hypothetical protein
MAERIIQWAEGMSAERFVQEMMLRITPALTQAFHAHEWAHFAEDEDTLEQHAETIAKVSYALAEACHMAVGPDTVPRADRLGRAGT